MSTESAQMPLKFWQGLALDYGRSRRELRTLSLKSSQNLRYVVGGLAGHLDRAGVDPHGDAAVLVAAVEDWLAGHPTWAAVTMCTNLGLVRPFLEWSAGRGRMTGGVAGQLRNPRKPRPLPRALPARAVDALLAVVPDSRGRVIVLLEAQCGLRRAEITTLRWPGDVDLLEGAVHVSGKGGVDRVVYPSEETADALRVWINERGSWPGPLICRSGPGGRLGAQTPMTPTRIGQLVTGWLRDAGLKSMPHDGVGGHALRHTAATELLRAGANIRVVQSALGHASITTTARYLRVTDPEVKAAMSALNYGRRLRAVKEA